jgi:hypothetical protein
MEDDKEIKRFQTLADSPTLNRDEFPTDAELDKLFAPIPDDSEPKLLGEVMAELANGTLIDPISGETNLMAVIARRKEQR